MRFRKILLSASSAIAVAALASCSGVVTTQSGSVENVESGSKGEKVSELSDISVESNEGKQSEPTSSLEETSALEESSSSEEIVSSESTSLASNPNTTPDTKGETKTEAPEIKITNTDFQVLNVNSLFETIYGEFLPVAKYKTYNVYYRAKGTENYTKVDQQLLRLYKYNDSYKYRFDILGLKKGNYEIKITGVDETEDVLQECTNLQVLEFDRSGFAFSKNSRNQSGSGAYNDDGTLKTGAKVIYVDASNAKTVQAVVNGQTVTGLQGIIYAKQKKTASDILDIRLIGEIKASDLDYFGSSAEGLQIKGAASYQNMNITIEGVGEDASINGFGMLLRNTSNVEIRNLGILNFMDDGLSLDTDNSNIWIHNCDFYYGNVGSDADQAKGDGSTDVKGDSQFITFAYNHYYDSGKCSLCGMKSESGPNYIDYHHNWFDHSDSRHPRIRTMSVHVYNNYYDGNAKYGIGVTSGGSAFVENNYFRNCAHPMLISKQGTDAEGDGTFSGEDGGVIKAFNNTIIGAKKIQYQNTANDFGPQNATSFDAYLASTRDERIPDSIRAVAGGTAYDNFDTTIDLGVKLLESPEDALNTVKTYSGRLNGGDFKWTFTAEDDTRYDVNKELKAAVTNYHNTQIVSKLISQPQSGNEGGEQGGQGGSQETPVIGTIEKGSVVSMAKNGKGVTPSNNAVVVTGSVGENKGSIVYDSKTYDIAIKLDSKGKISFNLPENMKVKVAVCAKGVGGKLKIDGKKVGPTFDTTVTFVEFDLTNGDHTIEKGDVESYVFLLIFE